MVDLLSRSRKTYGISSMFAAHTRQSSGPARKAVRAAHFHVHFHKAFLADDTQLV